MNADNKFLMAFVFWIAFFGVAKGQQIEMGFYGIDEAPPSLRILDHNHFIKLRSWGHHKSEYGEGTYTIKNDTLTLHFKSTPDPGYYNVTESKDLSKVSVFNCDVSINVVVKIHLWRRTPIEGQTHYLFGPEYDFDTAQTAQNANIAVSNGSGLVVGTTFRGEKLNLSLSKESKKIFITTLARTFPLEIDLTQFYGKEVDLECFIYSPVHIYNKEERIEKYIIIKNTEAEIILKPIVAGKNEIIRYFKL